ncbi:MAG: fused MFS/spermidine synthase, partial [Candidatus Firestonebacteria bacterium]|nr:fused MFS/spermidine synthase [Candidatus Firestonebacteria bacterium]
MAKPADKAPAPGLIPGWMLLGTIFITGNVVMMLEVVGTRVIGPFFGVGLYVWSALITVTLLSLAGGYWVGGKWADGRRTGDRLYQVILASAVLTLAIPLLRNPILLAVSAVGFRLGALLGGVLLFGPALFLLGMVTPFATKLYTDRFEKLGSRVGLLYAISTLGSFLGTITMGFYLIPYFRISVILFTLGLVLLALPAVYFLMLRARRALALAAALVVGAALLGFYPRDQVAHWINPQLKLVHKSTSLYGELKVIDIPSGRLLLIDGVSQSGEDVSTNQALPPYVADMNSLLERFRPGAGRVLMIGLGGGSLIHPLLAAGMQVDVAEIDHQVVDAAERFFNIDPKKVNITLDDGRRFVRRSTVRYDAVVMNAFVGENTPAHLSSREFFQEAKRILNPGGVVLVNFVGYVQGPHRQASGALQATLGSAFAWCRVYFRESKDRFSNVLYVAGDAPQVAESGQDPNWQTLKDREVSVEGWELGPVCTDDYNPLEFLNRVTY